VGGEGGGVVFVFCGFWFFVLWGEVAPGFMRQGITEKGGDTVTRGGVGELD